MHSHPWTRRFMKCSAFGVDRRVIHTSQRLSGVAHSRTPWTSSEEARLRELTTQGKTRAEIANLLGRSVKSIEYAQIRRPDGTLNNHFWSPAEKDALRELHQAGKSMAQIMQTFPNRTYQAVVSCVHSLSRGTARKGPMEWTSEHDQHALSLYDRGLSWNEMAEIMQRSPSAILWRVRTFRGCLQNPPKRRWSEQDDQRLLHLSSQGLWPPRCSILSCRVSAELQCHPVEHHGSIPKIRPTCAAPAECLWLG